MPPAATSHARAAPPLRLKVARGLVELARLPRSWSPSPRCRSCPPLQALVTGSGGRRGTSRPGAHAGGCGCGGGVDPCCAGRSTAPRRATALELVRLAQRLADTFVEMVAVPWFVSVSGTAALNVWLRSLGIHRPWRVVRDLPLAGGRPGPARDGVAVNRGVLQTPLFHDRIMSMDTVTLGAGATLGPNASSSRPRRSARARPSGPARWCCAARRSRPRPRTGNPTAPWPVRG
jgi:hypothetical protein